MPKRQSNMSRRIALIAATAAIALWFLVPRLVLAYRSRDMMPVTREFIDAAARRDSAGITAFAADSGMWVRLRDNPVMPALFRRANLGIRPAYLRVRGDTAWLGLAMSVAYEANECGTVRDFALGLQSRSQGWRVAAFRVPACF